MRKLLTRILFVIALVVIAPNAWVAMQYVQAGQEFEDCKQRNGVIEPTRPNECITSAGQLVEKPESPQLYGGVFDSLIGD